MPELEKSGVNVIAICPELPEVIKTVVEKKAYTFKLLSDKDNAFAKSLGVVYKMENNLSNLYQKFGIDLEGTQGNKNDSLPIPITMLVEDNKVKMLHFDTDYTKRFEPDSIFDYL